MSKSLVVTYNLQTNFKFFPEQDFPRNYTLQISRIFIVSPGIIKVKIGRFSEPLNKS
jgi:hypothetical protein